MQVSVTFRKTQPSDALKQHALEKVNHLKKYFNELALAHIILDVEKKHHKADIVIDAHGMMMRGDCKSTDMYNSIDRAVGKLETQLKKYHHKLVHNKPRIAAKNKARLKYLEPSIIDMQEKENSLPAQIVESKELSLKPMMVDEAVMQMDLLNNDILVFVDVKTNMTSVLYRKKDQKLGLIEIAEK